jgi:aryl-alcohol dehydrogenase-like predicted oxidoreductase
MMLQVPPVETVALAPDYRVSRIIRGGWQLAGDHGPVERDRAIADMATFLDAGINTVDGADIYTGVEDMYGAFNSARAAAGLAPMQVHTKFVPDFGDLATVDAAYVRRIITRSLRRLNTDRLDLVQFHWWDTGVPRYLDTAQALHALQKEGLIAHIGGTNFDSAHAQEILDTGVPLRSMQTQYSLLDRRPARGLADLAQRHGVQLLCYGTLAGGFLTDRWLGQPEPTEALANRSLVKYKLIIEEFGGWPAFQALLQALHTIAQRHAVSLSSVAVRWVLDQPGVAAAIVGARYADRLASTLQVFGFQLDALDHALLQPILAACPGPGGEPYTLERDKSGPHGRIMKYNLNKS